jgi:DNA replication protein DnaC
MNGVERAITKLGHTSGLFEYLPEQDIECKKHGIYKGQPFKGGFNIKGQEGAIHYPECPKCLEEEEARRKEQEALDEIRRQEDRKIKRMKSMNIGRHFWDKDFGNFNAYCDELKQHLNTAEKFVKEPDGKLVMLGEHGNGKTHLAISILKALGGKIYTAYEIGIMIRQSYAGDLKEWEVLEELCTVPLLIIDEVEKIKDSEFNNNWMSYVVGKRYNDFLPIIFIANCHTQNECKAIEKPCPRCLEYNLENDVMSRIFEDGIVMRFNCEDYRQRIGEEYRNRKRKEGKNDAH